MNIKYDADMNTICHENVSDTAQETWLLTLFCLSVINKTPSQFCKILNYYQTAGRLYFNITLSFIKGPLFWKTEELHLIGVTPNEMLVFTNYRRDPMSSV